ncbi:phosphoribosylformylglycinamidine synthase subunit PurS [Mesobacillus zeae]|uniref:Phosphoribosylformylglycinamidine synthase subunit PurS n=1 Tax=Mesobacillus zeae TaxID=1917180 RepID=A0A398B243_9BACI|nr:phosphoribosylformylglycinamidine synthase subunit PurS [Mesobacillus zeae]RID81876.1 phosphoribosylformylglycinamidine synthase subunit PurS [Mesobacillus zeae]
MFKVKVYVTLRESVLDPQGTAVKNSLSKMGYEGVEDVRIGKYMELMIEDKGQDLESAVKDMCGRLLSNPVIEDYRYEIEECVVS